MSTDVFLQRLDFDQLIYARDSAQRLIDAKLQEQRIPVWTVEDEYVVLEYFSDYLAAAKYLYDHAAKQSAVSHLTPKEKKLFLGVRMVLASEYSEYGVKG